MKADDTCILRFCYYLALYTLLCCFACEWSLLGWKM